MDARGIIRYARRSKESAHLLKFKKEDIVIGLDGIR
jgi:hypothetical protein